MVWLQMERPGNVHESVHPSVHSFYNLFTIHDVCPARSTQDDGEDLGGGRIEIPTSDQIESDTVLSLVCHQMRYFPPNWMSWMRYGEMRVASPTGRTPQASRPHRLAVCWFATQKGPIQVLG